MTLSDSPHNSPKIRILIVDDTPETSRNLKRMLDYESSVEVVGVASNGLEGIKLTVAHQPDIVVMDVKMPEMDGITACEQIREQGLATAVIMMSVHGYPDHLRRSMMAGAKDFLVKPFSSDELLISIRRVTRIGPITRPTTTVIQIQREKSKVFIISDRAEALQQSLAAARNIKVAGWANDPLDLVNLTPDAPDVILVELRPSLDGLIGAHLLTRQGSPSHLLVIVPNQTELNYLNQSRFAAGLTFLAHPFSDETLAQTIQQLNHSPHPL
jgi:DNA-binding NarL/FixJ family response regulator